MMGVACVDFYSTGQHWSDQFSATRPQSTDVQSMKYGHVKEEVMMEITWLPKSPAGAPTTPPQKNKKTKQKHPSPTNPHPSPSPHPHHPYHRHQPPNSTPHTSPSAPAWSQDC